MTKHQLDALNFLSKFKSASMEQLMFFTGCSIQDINYLKKSNFIIQDDKTKILYHITKRLDIKTVIALDLIIEIKNEIKDFKYSYNYPIIFTAITNTNESCDIAVVSDREQQTFFYNLESKYSKADNLIIVVENIKYNKKDIKTSKEALICTYPIKIIDKIN